MSDFFVTLVFKTVIPAVSPGLLILKTSQALRQAQYITLNSNILIQTLTLWTDPILL